MSLKLASKKVKKRGISKKVEKSSKFNNQAAELFKKAKLNKDNFDCPYC